MLLDRIHFELIDALARSTSQAQAARLLGIERQIVHTRLSDLERITGHKMLHRRPYALTKVAQRLAVSAKIVVDGMRKVEAYLNAMHDEDNAVLTIMTNASVMIDDLADIRAELKSTLPNLEIRFVEGTISETITALQKEDINAGIVYENPYEIGIRSIPYKVDRLHAIMPSNHPLATLKEVSLAQMAKYKLLNAAAIHNLSQLVLNEAAKQKTHPKTSGYVPNYEVQAHMVAASKDEIAITLGHVARRFQTFRPIKIVPLSDAWAKATYFICVNDAGTMSDATQKFIELILQQFKGLHDSPR